MPSAIVQLSFLDPIMNPEGGEIYAKIATDDLGNFYTTEKLPFPDPGAVPSVISATNGKLITMSDNSLSGAYNFCHIQAVGGEPGFKDLE